MINAKVIAAGVGMFVLVCGVAVIGRARTDLDEARYANFSWTYLRTGQWVYGLHSPSTLAATHGKNRYIWADLNRVYVGALAALFRVTGPDLQASQGFSLFCAAVLLLSAYVLGHALGGHWVGCGLTVALSTWPRLFAAGVLGRPEAMLGAVVVWSLVFLVLRIPRARVIAGLLAGLAPGVHLNALAVIPGQIAWLTITHAQKRDWVLWGAGLLIGLALIWPGTLSQTVDILGNPRTRPPTTGQTVTSAHMWDRALFWFRHTSDFSTTYQVFRREEIFLPLVLLGGVWLLVSPTARKEYRPVLAATLAVFAFFLVAVQRQYVLYAVPFGVLWLLPAAGAMAATLTTGQHAVRSLPRPRMAMFWVVTLGGGFLGWVCSGTCPWFIWLFMGWFLLGSEIPTLVRPFIVVSLVAVVLAIGYWQKVPGTVMLPLTVALAAVVVGWFALHKNGLMGRRHLASVVFSAALAGLFVHQLWVMGWRSCEMSHQFPRWSAMVSRIRAAAGDADRLCGPEIYWFAFPDRVYRDWDDSLEIADSPSGLASYLKHERMKTLLSDQTVRWKFFEWKYQFMPEVIRQHTRLELIWGEERYLDVDQLAGSIAWNDEIARRRHSTEAYVKARRWQEALAELNWLRVHGQHVDATIETVKRLRSAR